MVTARAIVMVARPAGAVTTDSFRLVERDLPEPADGQVLVRNRIVSVDPYMRAQMSRSVVADDGVGATFGGATAGEVVQSTVAGLRIGDLVTTESGWCDYAVLDAADVTAIPAGVDPGAALSLYGMPALTAWAGLVPVGRMSPGETVLLSGASGAVGVVAAQLAVAAGCRVVGLTGSAANAAALRETVGIGAVEFRDANAAAELAQAAPDGVDLFLDAVGGVSFTLGLDALALGGRIVVCGSMASMDSGESAGLTVDGFVMRGKRIRMEGLVVSDHAASRPLFVARMTALVRTGRIRPIDTRVAGLDQTPTAFVNLFSGPPHLGKMLVEV